MIKRCTYARATIINTCFIGERNRIDTTPIIWRTGEVTPTIIARHKKHDPFVQIESPTKRKLAENNVHIYIQYSNYADRDSNWQR